MNISIYNGRDQWAAEGGLRKIFTTNIWTVALTLSTVADNVPVTIGLMLCSAPSVPQPVVQSRRRPLLGSVTQKSKGMGGLVSIVSYSRPSLMIIASRTQFHVERPWGQRPFSIVS